jgi:hypothetical protein
MDEKQFQTHWESSFRDLAKRFSGSGPGSPNEMVFRTIIEAKVGAAQTGTAR